MRGFLKKFENTFAAAAFAEGGEFEIAREILTENKSLNKKMKSLKNVIEITIDDLTSMAIAFAEAGESEMAVTLLKEAENKLEEVKRSHEKDLKNLILTPQN